MQSILIAILATYSVSTLLTQYDGPLNLFRFMQKYKPFNCTVCTGVIVAVPIALTSGLTLTEYLATIGIVIVMDRNL